MEYNSRETISDDFMTKFNKNPKKYLISNKPEHLISLRKNGIVSYLPQDYIEACLLDQNIQSICDLVYVDKNLTGIFQNYSYIFNYFPMYSEFMVMSQYPKAIITGCNFHVLPLILIQSDRQEIYNKIIEFYSRFYEIKEEKNYLVFYSNFFKFKVHKRLFFNFNDILCEFQVDINQIFIDMKTKLIFCTNKAAYCYKRNISVLTTFSPRCYANSVKIYGINILIPYYSEGIYCNKIFPRDFKYIVNGEIENTAFDDVISAILTIYLNRTITCKNKCDLNFEQQLSQSLVLEDEQLQIDTFLIGGVNLHKENITFIRKNEVKLNCGYYSYNETEEIEYLEFFNSLIEKYEVILSGAFSHSVFMNCQIEGKTTIFTEKREITKKFVRLLFVDFCLDRNIKFAKIPTFEICHFSDMDNNISVNNISVNNIGVNNISVNFNIKLIVEKYGLILTKQGFYCKTDEIEFLEKRILTRSDLKGNGVRNRGTIYIPEREIDRIRSVVDNSLFLLNYSYCYLDKFTPKKNKIEKYLTKRTFVSFPFGDNLETKFMNKIVNGGKFNVIEFVKMNRTEKMVFCEFLKKRQITIVGNRPLLPDYYGQNLTPSEIEKFVRNVEFYLNPKYYYLICKLLSDKEYLNRKLREDEFTGYYYDINERNKRLNCGKRFVINCYIYTLEELKNLIEI